MPPSPRPPSRREGGAQKFISPGAAPPAPRRRAAYGTYRDSRTSALRREACGSPQERRQTVAHSFAGAARVQPRGCKGRSPLHKITLSPPLPAGKGVGGMGAETKLKAGQRQDPPTPKNKSSNIHRRVMCRTPQSGMIRSRNHRAWMRLRKQKKQKETERLDRNSESQQMPRGTAGPPGRHTPHTERHRSRQLLRTHRICRSRQNNPAGNDGRMHKTGRGHRADQRI